jgi:hypothetical protein
LTDEKTPRPKPSETLDPAEASGLQEGVADAIVDFELTEPSTTVRIPQPKRKKRVVFKY